MLVRLYPFTVGETRLCHPPPSLSLCFSPWKPFDVPSRLTTLLREEAQTDSPRRGGTLSCRHCGGGCCRPSSMRKEAGGGGGEARATVVLSPGLPWRWMLRFVRQEFDGRRRPLTVEESLRSSLGCFYGAAKPSVTLSERFRLRSWACSNSLAGERPSDSGPLLFVRCGLLALPTDGSRAVPVSRASRIGRVQDGNF